MKILLIEDDMILNDILEEFLSSLGYEVIIAFDGSEAQDLVYSTVYSLIISDVNLPSVNGFELLRNMRESGIKTPTIFLTSRNTPVDMEEGFNSGCDDYLKKPFELEELKLRINNIKRFYNLSTESKYSLDENIQYDFSKKLLIVNDKEIFLAKKETKIFEYLLQNIDKVISLEDISINVWGYDNTPNESTLRTYIKNIRKIIGSDYIQNIKGVGYMLKSSSL